MILLSLITNFCFLPLVCSSHFQMACMPLVCLCSNKYIEKRDSTSVTCLLNELCSRVSNEGIYKKVDYIWRVKS